jgi:hypothetical protein
MTLDERVIKVLGDLTDDLTPEPDPYGRVRTRWRRHRRRRTAAASVGLVALVAAGAMTAVRVQGDSAPNPTDESNSNWTHVQAWSERLYESPVRGGLAGDKVYVLALTTTVAQQQPQGQYREVRVLFLDDVGPYRVALVGLVLDNFKENLISLYGAGDDASSRLSAAGWAALTTAVISGLVAGIVAYFYLRWTQRRAGTQALRWPAYAIAGAGPGLALMVAEVIVRTLGSRVLTLAGEVSEADGTVQRMLDESRVNYALVVLFVGAISAIVAFGRSLPSK